MNIKVILSISITHLLARKKQSLVAALGVTFGIMMYISLVGFMNGLNGMLDSLVVNRTPHVRLYNEIQPAEQQPIETAPDWSGALHSIRSIKPKDGRKEIRNAIPIMKALEQDPRVLGFSPKVNAQVFFTAGEIELSGIIDGIEVAKEAKLYMLGDYVTTGNMYELLTINNSIILGKGLADKMMVNIGDVVQVVTVQGTLESLKVIGFFQSGLADIDNIQSFAALPTVQKLLGQPSSYITDLQIKLHDMASAPAIAKEYRRVFETNAMDIQTANAQFDTGTSVRNIISYAVSVTLLIVAGFGIYNILNMMIYEKMDDIAILKATGFSGRDVQWVFIFQALIIGIIGGIFGLIFGYVISSIIDRLPFETEALPTISTYPIDYNPMHYYIGIVFALVTTYLAGYLPARKAGSIDPVEIIRGK
jgi:lipoprotein-releasing system permease protein